MAAAEVSRGACMTWWPLETVLGPEEKAAGLAVLTAVPGHRLWHPGPAGSTDIRSMLSPDMGSAEPNGYQFNEVIKRLKHSSLP